MSEEKKVYELPHTLQLKHPFSRGTETIKELTFSRRPKGKDWKGIPLSNMKMDDMMTMAHRILEVPISLIEELDTEDLMSVVEVMTSFLPNGPTTGEISS